MFILLISKAFLYKNCFYIKVNQIKCREKLLMAFCDLMKALYSNILSLYPKDFSDYILESRAVVRKLLLMRAIIAKIFSII